MGGSSPRQVETQEGSTTTRLPANQQRNVDLLMQGARDFYLSGGPQFYPGQTYAGPTAGELQSRERLNQYAGGVGGAFANQAVAGDQFWLNPENIFNPGNIPGFRQSQQAVTDLATRNLTEQILPGIRSGSIAQGALGGSRQEIGQGLAVAGTSRSIADALAQMELGAYGQGLNMYNAAAARAPQTFALGAAPAGLLEYTGGLERADQQLGVDESVARFNFEQLAPLLNLEALQALTGTAGQYGGTVESFLEGIRRQRGGGVGLSQGLGLVLTAASLFSSHSFLKEGITPATGFLSGLKRLGIYHWRYKGSDRQHIGPMAEEFHEIFNVGDGFTLHIGDVLGVLLGAIKELALQTEGAR